jgi:glycine cleavage system H protein
MSKYLFHKEHTWINAEEDNGTIGISDFAQEQLGEILYLDIPEEGTELVVGEEFGQIESAKSMSSLIAPVSGEVIKSNQALEDDPEIINASPYEDGWIIKVKLSDPSELDNLLDKDSYETMVAEEEE